MSLLLGFDRDLPEELIQVPGLNQGSQELHLPTLGVLLVGEHGTKTFLRLLQSKKYRHIECCTAPDKLLKAAFKVFGCVRLVGAHVLAHFIVNIDRVYGKITDKMTTIKGMAS